MEQLFAFKEWLLCFVFFFFLMAAEKSHAAILRFFSTASYSDM